MAKRNYPHIFFQRGNMVDWKPEMNFDLVTSTCDAINHILEPEDVKKVMKNVYSYLNPGGVKETGYQDVRCTDQLLESESGHAATWFIIAKK